MKDDTLELIVRGQEDLREEMKGFREELVQIRIAMAEAAGRQKGRASVIGAVSGFASAAAVHVFGPTVLNILHIRK